MPYDAGYTVIIDERWPNNRTKYKKWDDGEEHWYNEKGDRHNANGPAIIYSKDAGGNAEYWVNGIYFKDVTTNEELMIKLLLE